MRNHCVVDLALQQLEPKQGIGGNFCTNTHTQRSISCDDKWSLATSINLSRFSTTLEQRRSLHWAIRSLSYYRPTANPRPCNGFGLGLTRLGPRLPLPDDALKIVMRGQGKGRSGGGVVAETTKAPQRELGPRPDP